MRINTYKVADIKIQLGWLLFMLSSVKFCLISALLFTSGAWHTAIADESVKLEEAAAQEKAKKDEVFSQCIDQIQVRARDEGYSQLIQNEVIPGLTPIERVIKLDRSQPEFTEGYPEYHNRRLTAFRINKGHEMMAEYSDLLWSLNKKYQVPPQYLVAFWGLETNYGSYLGKMNTLNSLVTLACDPRRSAYFTEELFNLFFLIDKRGVPVDKLLGSWAGAMGNMQFMPSAFRNYGIDGDGDGNIDLWNSVPDALTSAANYLNQIGWQGDQLWGREVRLPKGFDLSKVDLAKKYTLGQWNALGVTKVSGAGFPDIDMSAQLVLPTGYLGKAYFVYDNFKVILKWNNSRFYGLAVGELADKLKQPNSKVTLYPDTPKLRFEDVVAMQEFLNEAGFDVGKADGIIGTNTRKAIRQFQINQKLPADGYPSEHVFKLMRIDTQA